MTKKRSFKLNPVMEKRIRRSGFSQPRHGDCIICGGNWDDCPHSRADIELAIQAVKLAEVLGIEVK